jgi:hypothetical protein
VTPFQKYFDRAYKDAKDAGHLGADHGIKTQIPIAIFLRSKGANHEYAGKFDTNELHFSGSLPKVAAMFGGFKLLKAAGDLIAELKTTNTGVATAKLFFDKLEPRLNLGTAVDEIKNATGINKRPLYDQVLKVTGFPGPSTLSVEFTTGPDGFATHMRKMIVPSNNCSAGECIRRISYPYMNVALMEDGFFDRGSMKGIWLCGDYITDGCFNKDKKQTFIRLPTENDCDEVTHFCGSAQNTTAKPMADFFLRILLRTLVDPKSSDAMRILLQEGQLGVDPSFLTRSDVHVALKFKVDGVKIGQGPIKKDSDRGNIEVRSEGITIIWNNLSDPAVRKKFDDLNLTGEGAICWQNVSNAEDSQDGVVEVINNAVEGFINQATLVP